MADPVLDTLDYCETLEKSQVPHYQAKAHARGLNEALVAATAELATKADIENLRVETKADIENLRVETKSEIIQMKSDIIAWNVGMLVALAVIIVTAVVGIVPMMSK
uniref:DUF1640 domain-containing protein n=1 Tax=Candidatus Kentrum sp. LPFa TaxID=2126335 RepID=A0A450XWV8_9GAMM|nr:MAG: hypothetical protein BECKLPF1236A_GA0070988_101925 [Candidatus Kentron sp. LPFa]VFK33768.1 MAG: hypothetical protein BECKLPF1236C_GA0070990_102234 [Candidatus Kentron sp. LPFa]